MKDELTASSLKEGGRNSIEAKLPNFLLVGTTKSGTTSLYHYLKQHPEVYMSEMKEPRFFASSIFKKLNHKDPCYEIVPRSAIFTSSKPRM